MGAGTNGAFFRKGKKNFAEGTLEWKSGTSHKYAMSLLDLSDWVAVKAVTGCADNGSGAHRITAVAHGLSTDDAVHLTQVGGVTNCNGTWFITKIDNDTYDLQGSTFGGTYTSGGYSIPLDVIEFVNDITAAAVEETKDLTTASLTALLGVLDAADATFTAASGDTCDALLIHRNDTPAGTNDQVIAIITEGTGLPVVLSGADVTIAWSSSIKKILRL